MACLGRGRRTVAAAVVVLAMLGAACGGGGNEGERAGGAGRDPGASQPGGTAGGNGEPGGGNGEPGGGTGQPGGGPGQPGQPGGQDGPGGGPPGTATTAKPSEPPAVHPPAPGTYHYATSGTYTYGGRDHALPPRTTLVVDPPSGVAQRAAREVRDVDGNGPLVETMLRYERDGLYLDLLRVTNRLDGADDRREYRPAPPLLLAPRSADVGYRTSFDAADGGTNAHVDVHIERRQTVTVDGAQIECYLVRTVTTFRGTIEGSGDGTSCVSLVHRLPLTEDVTTRFTVGPAEVRGAYRATLERLAPAG